MKSTAKALQRNYNAVELELYCQNRFYGPLVVALNTSRPPYYLSDFSMATLMKIEDMNRSLHNRNIKDDFVLDCLLKAPELNLDLRAMHKTMDLLTFYMYRYKSSWCPDRKDSHDSKSCIYAHHMRDFRRPPEIFKYAAEDCESMQKADGQEYTWELCPNGLLCKKCHTTVEKLYHPDQYKRKNCDRHRCNQQEICAFHHGPQEKNQALKMAKKYQKQVQGKTYEIDIDQINSEIIAYYQRYVKNHGVTAENQRSSDVGLPSQ
jgi:hypothetical protein